MSAVREQAGKQGEEARARLAAIVDSSEDAIISKSLAGIIATWNASAERLFGYCAEEIVGQPIARLIPPELQAEEAAILARVSCGERIEHYETVRTDRNGGRIEMSLTLSPIRDGRGSIIGVSTIARDIAERKGVEKALRESKDKLALALRSAGMGVWRLDLRQGTRHFDDQVCRCLGIDSARFAGAAEEFYAAVHPDDRDLLQKALDRTIATGALYEVEYRAVWPDGSVHHIAARGQLARDAARQPERIDGLVWDITERKRAEEALREAQAKLQAHATDLEETVARRTASLHETIGDLEHFSYAIVHDLRAPLRALQGFATLIEEDCGDCNRGLSREYFRRIKIAAGRMDRLIADSLSYSEAMSRELTLKPIDLVMLLRGLAETYPNLLPDKADIQLPTCIPSVLGNEAALTQCFANLLGNAVKYAKPGTRPQVRVWAELRSAPHGEPLNPVVRVWVEDNGIGIPKAFQHRLFGMFQRASNEQEGTGIGLAIVRKVVDRMGGKVGLESEEGQGSRFWVELPRA
jgi:PAS domain S-box-containing protein